MPNVAEIVRNVTLGASIMMPGAAVDQTRKFDTSSPLSQGRTELVAGTYSRIDRNNPTITVFDQELSSPAPSAEPSFPVPSLEPTPLPTDPRTGLVICPSPSPEVSPSPSPTPIIIAAAGEDQSVTVVLPQEAASPAPSIGELFPSLSPAPTDPLTGAIICPTPEPSAPPSAPPSAEPTPEATPSGPAPDSFEVLLDSKIDKKVKFSDVRNALDDLYEDSKYKEALKRLYSPLDDTFLMKKTYLVESLKDCEEKKGNSVSNRVLYCSAPIEFFVLYARQYHLDSGNEIDAEINAAFMDIARLSRSAAVNSGVPANRLDKLIKSEAKFYDEEQ